MGNKFNMETTSCIKVGPFEVNSSKHFQERLQKRSINMESISHAILYGDYYFKQGLVFYILGKNHLPKNISPQQQKKCRNLIVVMDESSNMLITTYRNNNPLNYIRKKSKRKDVFRIE